jgi:hypothetical protein
MEIINQQNNKDMKFKGIKAVDILQKCYDVGIGGISHVGAANYASREAEAKATLDKATDELYDEAEKLDEVVADLLRELEDCVTMLEGLHVQESALESAKKAIEKALL